MRSVFLAMVLGIVVTVGILLFGIISSPEYDPYEKMLEAEQIEGDWTLFDQREQLNTWDRQGGYQEVTRAYAWSEARLFIEVMEYFADDRAERLFPVHGPSQDEPMTVPLGDDGIYWTSGDIQYVHFRQGNYLVYSWMMDGGNEYLDFDWFMEVMELQELKLVTR